MKLIWVIQAKPLNGYCMELTFNDGCHKAFDFGTLVGTNPIYDYLRNPAHFGQYRLDGWTLSWDDGRVDVAPEFLYEHGTPL